MKVIRLDGPGKNSLSTAQMALVAAQFREAAGAAVLLTGTGDAFSAGLDLREVHALDTPGVARFLRELDAFFLTIATYPGPTVAAVNGHAIAGGCVLAQACDHRVMTTNPKAKIGLNEVALGLQFPPITLRLCRARIARRYESEVLLGAHLFNPADALRTGLVDELAEDPVGLAEQRLAALGSHPREAYAVCKRELRTGLSRQEGDDAAYARILDGWSSPELKARLAGFFDKKR